LIVLALNTGKIFLLTLNYRVYNLPHIQETQRQRAHNPLHKQVEINRGYFFLFTYGHLTKHREDNPPPHIQNSSRA
jgi:hypothetical protein